MAKRKIAPGFWWDAERKVGYIDFRVQGRDSYRVQRVVRGATYREALREFGDVKDEAARLKKNPREIPTLKQYLSAFGRLRPLRASTAKTHEYMLSRRILPVLGNLPLDKITAARLMEFRAGIILDKVSPSTANRHVSLVRKLLNEARLRGIIPSHPAPAGTVAPLPETPPLAAFLTDSERTAFITAFVDEIGFRRYVKDHQRLGPVKEGKAAPGKRRYGGGRRGDSEATTKVFQWLSAARPFFLCAVDTGLTRGDLVNLRWHQVDFQGNMITLRRSKTSVPINIPLTARLAAELKCLPRPADTNLVFLTPDGQRWPESRIQRIFVLAKALAGITRPFRFHDLRHDFASALAREGVSLYVIAQLLGHTSTRMTMRYAHLHPDNLRAAIDGLPGRGASGLRLSADLNVDGHGVGATVLGRDHLI